MTHLHVQYFLEVAKLKSFTKAAETLYVAQPSISRQISNLEKELGVVLFDRTKQNIQLTDAGKIMFDFFSDTQNTFERKLLEAKSTNQSFHDVINVGIPSHFENSNLWHTIYLNFSTSYPNITINLHVYPIRTLLEKINTDELDIILCYDSYLKDNTAYEMLPVQTTNGYILIHENNPISSKEDISLHDLQDQTLYTLPPSVDPYCKKSMLSYCEEQAFKPSKIIESANIETMLFALTYGDGYTLFSDWIKPTYNPSYKSIPIIHADMFTLFWKKNKTKSLQIFANEFQFWAQSNN